MPALKARYLSTIDELEREFGAHHLDERELHHQLSRTVREFAAEVFGRVGLLPPQDAPPVRHEPDPEVSETDALQRLSSFFEELEAARAAEVHEPKPWMVEWARGLK